MAYTKSHIKKALKELKQNPHPNFPAELVDADIYHWEAKLIGPSDMPYEGGVFKLTIHFQPQYSIEPPEIFFNRKVYHPNILEKGVIALKMLTTAYWSPGSTIIDSLKSIVQMLLTLELGEVEHLNPEIAYLYLADKATYDSKAREMVNLYTRG